MARSLDLLRTHGFDLNAVPHRMLGDSPAFVYAEDHPDSIRYLTLADLQPHGIEPDVLHEAALRYLQQMPYTIDWKTENSMGIVFAGGDFESSHFLNEALWAEVEAKIEGFPVIYVPCKDILAVVDSTYAGLVQSCTDLARKWYSESPYPVSRQVFCRRDGEMRLH